MVQRKNHKRPPIGGLAVLGVFALVALIPLLANSTPTPGSAGTEQSMELRGHWLGMTLAGAESASARALGVPPVMAGVVIVDLAKGLDAPAVRAGLVPRDVIVSVDGTNVATLAELYTLTTKLDGMRPVTIDLVRQGQPMRAMLPPGAAMPQMQQMPQMMQPGAGMMPAAPPGAMGQPQAMPTQPVAQWGQAPTAPFGATPVNQDVQMQQPMNATPWATPMPTPMMQ
jgi:hypothetical protein